MKKRPLWSLLAIAVTVAACACPEVRTKASAPGVDRLCTKQSDICLVFVDVTSCDVGGIRADAPTLGLENGNTEVDIFWILRTEGFKFEKRDGVAFKPGVKFAGEFGIPRGGHEIFRWRDHNPHGTVSARPFPYTITILRDDGSACGSLDPTIINDL